MYGNPIGAAEQENSPDKKARVKHDTNNRKKKTCKKLYTETAEVEVILGIYNICRKHGPIEFALGGKTEQRAREHQSNALHTFSSSSGSKSMSKSMELSASAGGGEERLSAASATLVVSVL